ncbi:hypothetical protein LDENG_00094460 [Lucifuga dentata]|nr:hypothetical protein LDENG_00094460 [Lucifuga dentata]
MLDIRQTFGSILSDVSSLRFTPSKQLEDGQLTSSHPPEPPFCLAGSITSSLGDGWCESFFQRSDSQWRALMMASTRRTVLSLYIRVFRIARTWQAHSGVRSDTETERKYIVQEARTLFRQNQQMTDQESIKRCIEECEARIDIGLHYRNPYPRPIHLPPMGLATQKGRKLRSQQRLRKQAKPVYLQSYDQT